jgi:hypothetical protein
MSYVQHEDKYLGSLDVPQELKPKAFVGMCAFNDPRNVCYGHPIVIDELDVSY